MAGSMSDGTAQGKNPSEIAQVLDAFVPDGLFHNIPAGHKVALNLLGFTNQSFIIIFYYHIMHIKLT